MVRGLLLALLCWVSAVSAAQKVDHLSVNQVVSRSNEPLNLTMNVVGDPFVVQQLRFFLLQNGNRYPLARKMDGDFLIHLNSQVPARGSRIQVVVTSLFQDEPDKLIYFNIDLDPASGGVPTVTRKVAQDASVAKATEVAPKPPKPRKQELKLCPMEGRSFWSMARETAPALGVGHYGAMLALFQTNPECFPGGNPNQLICKELRCPDPDSLREWQDEAAAKARFKELMKASGK
ncbi:type IV pilus assembly protein FimV [Ferrimonas futtsuensis]|uniref:type IV pilus assembly protein FimV n=1 Tax=Ferrimonas futtsuensis TaxID=364764 RepID=UPI000415E7B8|nr:hypothetical protein [Ferrimonas futtsuensis]